MDNKTVYLVGCSGSGKTSTIIAIINNLREKLSIATVKYIHHPEFTIDPAGKDTRKHRDAGAIFTVCAAPKETAILINREKRDEIDEIDRILKNLPKHDLVIFESYNRPSQGSNTILCGNNNNDLEEFYHKIIETNILAISSFQLEGKWRNIDIINSGIKNDLDLICDIILAILN